MIKKIEDLTLKQILRWKCPDSCKDCPMNLIINNECLSTLISKDIRYKRKYDITKREVNIDGRNLRS